LYYIRITITAAATITTSTTTTNTYYGALLVVKIKQDNEFKKMKQIEVNVLK
jgi:hypothetical protein